MRKILIIEDEPAIADNITYALETEGFTAISALTGQDGLNCLESEDVDLIILDVGLPDISGFDLCRRIRKETEIPVIFLTARAEEIDRVVGLEIGGDDYIVKPFSPRELSARVKAILRRTSAGKKDSGKGSPEKDSIAQDSPFDIDEKRFLIRYQNKPLELTRYEYRILRQLIRRPGWVFSREQLMTMAWEEPDASFDRTVDAHIKTLRAKLKKITPDTDPIVTHRGVGYALRESW